jgi:hypothetical protein
VLRRFADSQHQSNASCDELIMLDGNVVVVVVVAGQARD